MSASVLRSPTHTHTVRLTLHAHITLDVSHTVWLVGVCTHAGSHGMWQTSPCVYVCVGGDLRTLALMRASAAF